MPRKYFRKYLPTHESIKNHKFFSRFGDFLHHPNLWHLNRHSVSGGVAVGFFAGLVPGPLQMLTAAVIAVPLRVNLPVAVLLTFYTNPFTIAPLYWAGYQIGSFFIDSPGAMMPPPDFEWSALGAWFRSIVAWAIYYAKPLGLGLFIMAVSLAGLGYLAVQLSWRGWVMYSWHRRKKKRAARAQT